MSRAATTARWIHGRRSRFGISTLPKPRLEHTNQSHISTTPDNFWNRPDSSTSRSKSSEHRTIAGLRIQCRKISAPGTVSGSRKVPDWKHSALLHSQGFSTGQFLRSAGSLRRSGIRLASLHAMRTTTCKEPVILYHQPVSAIRRSIAGLFAGHSRLCTCACWP